MTHPPVAAQGRKPPPVTGPRKEMKSRAHEAFASTGQDISSLKICPSPGRAVLKWNPHTRSVLYTSQLKPLYYSACIIGVQRVFASPTGFPFIFLLTSTLRSNSPPTAREQFEKVPGASLPLPPLGATRRFSHHMMYHAAAPAATAMQAARISCTRGCFARATAA